MMVTLKFIVAHTAPDSAGGAKGPGPGPPTNKGPHHVHVFSHMYDMCVPLSHFY